MNTRAKMVCTSVTDSTNGSTTAPEKHGEQVTFTAQYTGSPEDNTYSAATPSASMTMLVSNPELYGKFVEGKAYYFDITEAE